MKFQIHVVNSDNKGAVLNGWSEPCIRTKLHFEGLTNAYGHYYHFGNREPVFIEDGLTDESRGVTLESLKELEKQYFLPKYKIVKADVR